MHENEAYNYLLSSWKVRYVPVLVNGTESV